MRPSSRPDTFRRARARGAIFSRFLFYYDFISRTCLSGPLHVFLSLFRPWVGFPLFRDPSLRPFLFCEPLLYFYEYGCGLWASSGPFPLLAHQGLYKRGRDPPTNPSRHLKKVRVALHLKWLLKEGQGGKPTAATAAAPVVPPPCPPPRPPPSPALPTDHLHAAFQPPPPLPPPQAAVAAAAARSLHHHHPSSSTDHPLHLPLHLHPHLR